MNDLDVVRTSWRGVELLTASASRLGPVEIGARLGVPASTVHAVLVRCRLNRLSHLDQATGEPVRRYEHDHPGALLHVDVEKLGDILAPVGQQPQHDQVLGQAELAALAAAAQRGYHDCVRVGGVGHAALPSVEHPDPG